MADMTVEERRRLEDFLAPSRIAVVATVGKTGMPQLTPNWYDFSDGRMKISDPFFFTTGRKERFAQTYFVTCI